MPALTDLGALSSGTHSKQLLTLLQAISWESTPQALREVRLFSYLTFGKTEIWNPVATQLKRS